MGAFSTTNPGPADDAPCCSGADRRVPRPIDNPPGKSSLSYRVGTQGDFFATMIAALPTRGIQVDGQERPITPLRELTARTLDDPAIALIDSASAMADVLTFYQERIADEGYLRTATEGRSVAELGKLVGYAPRPGISASVPLAFELEQTSKPMILPRGTRVQSLPGPGQVPQTFETTGPIEARVEWNRLQPLATRPQQIEPRDPNDLDQRRGRPYYFQGATTGLKPGDALLLTFNPPVKTGADTPSNEMSELWRVLKVDTDLMGTRTTVFAEPWEGDDSTETRFLLTQAGAALRAYTLDPQYGFVRSKAAIQSAGGDFEALRRALAKFVDPRPKVEDIKIQIVPALDNARASLGRAGALIESAPGEIPALDALLGALKDAKDKFGTLDGDQANIRLWLRSLKDAVNTYAGPSPTGAGAAPRPTLAPSVLDALNRVDALVVPLITKTDPAEIAAAVTAALGGLSEVADDLRDLGAPAAPVLARVTNGLIAPLGPLAADPDRATKVPAAVKDYYSQHEPIFGSILKVVKAAAEPSKLPSARPALKQFLDNLYREVVMDDGVEVDLQTPVSPLARLAAFLKNHSTAIVPSALFDLLQDTLREARDRDTELVDRLAVQLTRVNEGLKALQGFRFLDADAREFSDALKAAVVGPRGADLSPAGRDAAEKLAKIPGGDQLGADELNDLLAQSINVAAFSKLTSFLGRESRLFDEGSFPRLRPFFDDFRSSVETYWMLAVQNATLDGELAAFFLLALSDARPEEMLTADPNQGPAVPMTTAVREVVDDDPFESFIRGLVADDGSDPTEDDAPEPGLEAMFQRGSDLTGRLLLDLTPELRDRFYPGIARADVSEPPPLRQIEALRAVAAPFGSYAPPETKSTLTASTDTGTGVTTTETALTRAEWPLNRRTFGIAFPDFMVGHFDLAVVTFGDQVVRLVTQEQIKGLGRFTLTKLTDPALRGVRLHAELDPLSVTIQAQEDPSGTGNPVRVTIELSTGETGTIQLSQEAPEGRFLAKASPTLGDIDAKISGRDVTLAVTLNDYATRVLPLDVLNDKILPGSHIALSRAGESDMVASLAFFQVQGVDAVSRTDFGITAKVTELSLDREWRDESEATLAHLRRIAVYTQGETLQLVDEPYDADVRRDVIVLDGIYPFLSPGRLLIVEGERSDLPGTRGVRAAEVAKIRLVDQIVELPVPPTPGRDAAAAPGDDTPTEAPRGLGRPCTQLTLTRPLRYSYVREQVNIYGNVAKADHGETLVPEVLGGVPAGRDTPAFRLKRKPLTHTAAATPSGVAPALEVRVDGVSWRPVERFDGLSPTDCVYLLQVDEQGGATVVFGDGVEGARPPSGFDNIVAVYRVGIGPGGNVGAGQITQLLSRPQGLKAVLNPLAASGGAGPDPIEAARARASVGLRSLERLVSLRDYEDLALKFAGIAKARARPLGGPRGGVFLTIAGVDDTPISKGSDLYKGLLQSLRRFGEPGVRIAVEPRRRRLIIASLELQADPGRQFDDVAAAARKALTKLLSFDARDLAQDVVVSDLVAAVRGVPGVARSNFTAIGLIDERNEAQGRPWTPQELAGQIQDLADPSRHVAIPDRLCVRDAGLDPTTGNPRPAGLAYLSQDTTQTLLIRPGAG